MTRVGAAIQMVGRGQNGPVGSWIRYLVNTVMHKTRRDPATQAPKGLSSIGSLDSLIHELIEEGFVEFKGLPRFQA
jgi:hypothetical protein